jgi:hypothetical protein
MPRLLHHIERQAPFQGIGRPPIGGRNARRQLVQQGKEFRRRSVRAFFPTLWRCAYGALRSHSALILEAIDLLLKKRSAPSIEKPTRKAVVIL